MVRLISFPFALAPLVMFAMLLPCIACGDDGDESPVRARIGESCTTNASCSEGLLCNRVELRCVRLCALGSDDCGDGIACESADDGSVGFCPLPPP
jgi:hypothetical protein